MNHTNLKGKTENPFKAPIIYRVSKYTRWAPIISKWSYNPYKLPFKWVGAPPCRSIMTHLVKTYIYIYLGKLQPPLVVNEIFQTSKSYLCIMIRSTFTYPTVFSPDYCRCELSSYLSHEKKTDLLSIESWLFDRDPYDSLL